VLNTNKQIEIKKLGFKEYSKALEIQNHYHDEICNIKLSNRKNNRSIPTPNYLLFVEHNHIYTIGKSGDLNNLLFDQNLLKKKGIELIKIGRGGDITYHGPGQVVCYPIFDLENFFTDIHKYLRTLELIVVMTLKKFGINSTGSEDHTGVWVDKGTKSERKICALGIKASRWVTKHGLALNVNTDLSYFDGIIPCGLKGKSVTSMSKEIGRKLNIDEVIEELCHQFKIFFKNQ
jgi:lipoyl(octanoyl) transferase